MKNVKLLITLLVAAIIAACGGAPATNQTNAGNTAAAPASATPAAQTLTVTERPQRIKDLMAGRGEQDDAAPKIRIDAPGDGSTVETSTVRVLLSLGGSLKGYKPGMNEETHTGNHIHVILDNQAYEAYYNVDEPFELKNVQDGEHTLRVFPSRPWHESYKNDGAAQMVKFTVKNGGADLDEAPTDPNAHTAPTPEGKEMQPSTAGAVDPKKPLLTYSRPKGEYKAADADAIMIDFWLSGATLAGEGGEYRVRYSVDGGEAGFIDKWEPIWLAGWTAGKHSIKLELVDAAGNLVDNGGYNSTTREITVTK